MTELEIKKLKLEIQTLEKSSKRDRIKFVVDLIQGLSILVGIIIAFNEFVLKDRESENQRSKVTLEYVQKINDREIRSSTDSLTYFRDLAYAMPVADSREDSLFNLIAPRFDSTTMNLAHYYNVLYEGINSGYFDKKMCNAFLATNVKETMDILSEFQSRVGGPGGKWPYSTPKYSPFRGMIEFYIQCFNLNKESQRSLPKYDIDKPAI